jgi:hypothetical protein
MSRNTESVLRQHTMLNSAIISNSKVGANVQHEAVLEVATRLQTEGLARLDEDPDSALVALRQAFLLERQFGIDGECLCRTCAAVCRALSRIPTGLPEAVTTLILAIDTLEARAADPSNGNPGLAEHRDFLVKELLGLAQKLSGFPQSNAHLDDLRAADRAYERLAALASAQPLRVGVAADLSLTPQELFFQLANTAKRIGTTLMHSSSARDQEAACFYLQRSVRKLRLAGVAERDAKIREVHALILMAEGQLRALQDPISLPSVAQLGVPTTTGSGSDSCVLQ